MNTAYVRTRRRIAALYERCTTCCIREPKPGLKRCQKCLDVQRRYRQRAAGKPIDMRRGDELPVSPLPPFDAEADRREELLALSELWVTHYVGRLPL